MDDTQNPEEEPADVQRAEDAERAAEADPSPTAESKRTVKDLLPDAEPTVTEPEREADSGAEVERDAVAEEVETDGEEVETEAEAEDEEVERDADTDEAAPREAEAADEEADSTRPAEPTADEPPESTGLPSEIEALRRDVLESVERFFHERLRAAEPGEEPMSEESRVFRRMVEDSEAPGDREADAGLRGRLRRLLRGRRGSGPVEQPPASEFVAERWFDFEPLVGYEVVEDYWVHEPFAHVTILYDADENRRHYHVSEPELSSFEAHLLETLGMVLRSDLMYEEIEFGEDRSAVFSRRLRTAINDYAASVEPGTIHKLIYYLVRDYLDYGEIDPLMRDEEIEDISCDGVGVPVYVFHGDYRDLVTNIVFQKDRLNSLTVRLAQMADKQISVADPLVDGTLPDGSRIQLTLGGEIATKGSNFTIRSFSDIPLTPVDLINYETFSVEQMAYFWLAIENGRSLMFAGGTGSGKTTSMNAVSFFIPPDSKVVSIEDTLEITLPHENWVQSTTRKSASASGRGEVSTYDLLESALRQRPEYILVGEIRTDPNVALTFFQAIGTGHTAYTTFHSDSVEGVLSRLANPPLQVPAQMLGELDIVSIQKQVFYERERVRRNDEVAELTLGGDQDSVDALRVFERNPAADTFEQVHESSVLAEIAQERGWDEGDVETAIADRERVLQYLIDEDITGYRDVAATIHAFSRDPEFVLEHIEAGDLRRVHLRREDR